MRHRAGIGMSENSDALIIVVSEETGQISVAQNGVLTRDYTKRMLEELLRKTLIPPESESGWHARDLLPFRRKHRPAEKSEPAKQTADSGKEV
jgi:diadenylate cyclase